MDQLFAEIRDNVQKEAEQLVHRARRVAERTLQHAREEARAKVAARRAAAEQEAGVQRERAKARRMAEVRRAELRQQEEFIERVTAMALERLRSMPREGAYRGWLERVLKAGLTQLGTSDAVVRCNVQDRGIVEAILAGTAARLAEEPVGIAGGVLVETGDGRVSVDCSAEAALRRVMDDAREEVVARIIGDRQAMQQ
ncbi:MAG: V-type ATP synthase subunit E [bacterium]|nr:V-type ATP synthase subunit E [bacterium]